MIVCTHCQAKNSLDSLFCKSCGREVTEADREKAREANSKLIAEGYTLLAEGRTEEAELVARAAIEADPKAGGAYSLLGMCFERKDDIVAALECYEQVVELNPDSALDKIKVTQMRNVLARRSEPEEEPNRKVAVLAAAAAVLLVGVSGALFAIMSGDKGATKDPIVSNQNPTTVADRQQAFGNIPDDLRNAQANVQNVDPNANANPGNGQVQPPQGNENAQGGGNENGVRSNPGYRLNPPSSGRGSLPNIGGNETEQVPPVTLDVDPRLNDPGVVGNPGNSGNANNGGGGQVTTPTRPDENDPVPVGGPSNTTEPKEKKNGSISITPHGGSRSNGGGGAFIDDDPKSTRGDANGLKAVMRAAREQMQVGSYDSAARALERAKQMGGDNGSVSKNLALCYEKLGKKNDAIQAYRAAKRHLESSSDPAAKSQLDTVNQALKNLGG